jgi:hypothetical protein
MPNTTREDSPGVWVVDFPTREDVVADRCAHLLPPMIAASASGPIIMIALLPPDVRFVDPRMPVFWLEAVINKGLKVHGIAVVTRSRAVSSVVHAFALAMKLREHPILARTFDAPADAVAWSRSVAPPRSSSAAAAG